LKSGLSEAEWSSLWRFCRRTGPRREDGSAVSVLLAFACGHRGLTRCAVLTLIKYIEVVAKRQSTVQTPALHARTAHASGLKVHDTITPLQWAGLWRVVVLLEHGLKQSICTGFGVNLNLGKVGLTEVRLVEVQLDWEVEACVGLLRGIAAAVHVFLVYLRRRSTVEGRTRIRLVGFVTECTAERAVR
jgi:hypothetical protein